MDENDFNKYQAESLSNDNETGVRLLRIGSFIDSEGNKKYGMVDVNKQMLMEKYQKRHIIRNISKWILLSISIIVTGYIMFQRKKKF